MATLKAAIKTALTDNSSWTALVTGGTQWRTEWGRNGLESATAPADSNGLLPLTAVLTLSTETDAEIAHSSALGFFQLWVYHDNSGDLITQAHELARTILNQTFVTVTGHGTPLLTFASFQNEFTADELGGAIGKAARYSYKMLY